MGTYKVADLEGASLDAAVAQCEGFRPLVRCRTYRSTEDGWGRTVACAPYVRTTTEWFSPKNFEEAKLNTRMIGAERPGRYSTDWAYGGPIIEREGIDLYYLPDRCDADELWLGRHSSGDSVLYGPTPLLAAMRCYVRSKCGDTVELP